ADGELHGVIEQRAHGIERRSPRRLTEAALEVITPAPDAAALVARARVLVAERELDDLHVDAHRHERVAGYLRAVAELTVAVVAGAEQRTARRRHAQVTAADADRRD